MSDHLKRRIGVGLLTAYGVGVMIGAGIYVLVGAVSEEAGIWAPLAFIVAGLVAAPSALSYSELSTRIPEAAGEAAYVEKGLRLHWLALAIGLAIVAAGTVSAAAVLRGGTGYLMLVLDVEQGWAIVTLGLVLCAIAILGVVESLAFAALLTVIELIGLGLVVWAGFSAPAVADWSAPTAYPLPWLGIATGAALAFFAFIGFEDLVNMAEEVRNPSWTMPRAILLSLVITSVIYALVSWATVRAVPLAQLAGNESPLADVWQAWRGGDARFLSAIAVFATLNGVLAQIIMASRVLYGLGKRSPSLQVFHRAHPRTGTPILATVLIGAAVVAAALTLPVATLARGTAALLLGVFCIVNLSLIMLKRREAEAPFRVPIMVPVMGLILSAAALAFSLQGVSH